MTSNAHALTEYLDGIKDKLTSAEYKEGCDLSMTLFKTDESQVYRMVYLQPQYFKDEDDDETVVRLHYEKKSALVKLCKGNAESIKKSNTAHVCMWKDRQEVPWMYTDHFESLDLCLHMPMDDKRTTFLSWSVAVLSLEKL